MNKERKYTLCFFLKQRLFHPQKPRRYQRHNRNGNVIPVNKKRFCECRCKNAQDGLHKSCFSRQGQVSEKQSARHKTANELKRAK